MLEIVKKYQDHPLVGQLKDIRSLGLIVFAVIVVLVSWSGVKAIQQNYQLEQQISKLQQQNNLKQLQNENQKLKNQYYNTPQYLELAARQNFGLAMPGEKELIVPKEVALARVKGLAPAKVETGDQPVAVSAELPFYQRNLQTWMNFFLHRN